MEQNIKAIQNAELKNMISNYSTKTVIRYFYKKRKIFLMAEFKKAIKSLRKSTIYADINFVF